MNARRRRRARRSLQAPGGRRGDPRVEAVRAAVQRLAEQQPPLLDRVDARRWSPAPRGTPRPAARRGTPRRPAASRCCPRSTLEARLGARRSAGASWRARAPGSGGGRRRRARSSRPTRLVDVLGGLGDDRIVERLRLEDRARARRSPARGRRRRGCSPIGLAQHADAVSGGDQPSRARAARPRAACASSTCSTLLCAAGGGARLAAGSSTNALVGLVDQRQRQRAGLLAEQVVVVERVVGRRRRAAASALRDLLLGRAGRRGRAAISAVAVCERRVGRERGAHAQRRAAPRRCRGSPAAPSSSGRLMIVGDRVDCASSHIQRSVLVDERHEPRPRRSRRAAAC